MERRMRDPGNEVADLLEARSSKGVNSLYLHASNCRRVELRHFAISCSEHAQFYSLFYRFHILWQINGWNDNWGSHDQAYRDKSPLIK